MAPRIHRGRNRSSTESWAATLPSVEGAGVVTLVTLHGRRSRVLPSADPIRIRRGRDLERWDGGKKQMLRVGSNRVVDPPAASFADDQTGFAQNPEVVRQQIGCEVEQILQVAVAPNIALEDGEDLEPVRIRESLEQLDSLFKRYCIKNY
jgi:hypothetical protein